MLHSVNYHGMQKSQNHVCTGLGTSNAKSESFILPHKRPGAALCLCSNFSNSLQEMALIHIVAGTIAVG
jgi:hypothetical protein